MVIDLSALRIAPCVGCFGCWTRTPGRCVIRDDAVQVYPKIAAARRVLYVSRLFCGGYDLPMKIMLERAIPIQQAFIRLVDGETHHFQRRVEPKEAAILAYGDIPSIVITFLRQILFLIPFIYLFPLVWDINGIFMAQPVSDALALILSAALVLREQHTLCGGSAK